MRTAHKVEKGEDMNIATHLEAIHKPVADCLLLQESRIPRSHQKDKEWVVEK
jgi:hypothetical protein